MPDQTVVLEQNEWQQTLAILCNAQGPGINWQVVNPLVMKIGAQLQAQTPGAAQGMPMSALPAGYAKAPGNGLDPEPEELNPRRVPRPQ